MQAIVDMPIDIDAAPLFRVALYKLGEAEHAFLFMPHHIIWDGWSFDILYSEISAVYGAIVRGEPIALAAPALTYADYARWLAEWMDGPECARQLQYWKTRFANAPLPKQPKTDLPPPPGMSGEGATEWVRFDRELTERLRDVARTHGLTLSMLTMSVYAAMMAAAIDTNTLVVGLPVRGRLAAEVEGVMGFFNNLLPVQFVVDPSKTLSDFLNGVKKRHARCLREPGDSLRAPRGRAGDLQPRQPLRPVPGAVLVPGRARAAPRLGPAEAAGHPAVPEGSDRGPRALADGGAVRPRRRLHLQLGHLPPRDGRGLPRALRRATAPRGRRPVAAARRTDGAERLAGGTAPAQAVGRRCRGRGGAAALAASANPTVAPGMPSVRRRVAASVFASDNERALAKIWAGLLDIDIAKVSPRDNFFDLGGNSLLAMRAVEASGRMLGFRIDARRYFYENLAQLASETGRQSAASATAAAAPRRARASRAGC
jgi:hypothetical protein